jgi:DnaJ-related protein SCJ1
VDHIGQYTLDVIAGMPEGYEVVFEGEADESPDWDAGDVVIRVRSRKDKGGWRRKESSLYWKETIGVYEVCSPSNSPFRSLDTQCSVRPSSDSNIT